MAIRNGHWASNSFQLRSNGDQVGIWVHPVGTYDRAEVIARGDAHTGVQVEALVFGGEAHPAGSALLRVVGAVSLVGHELGERPRCMAIAAHASRGARLGRLTRRRVTYAP